VAQLRILAEVTELTGGAPKSPLRMFVTDTLGDPYVEQEWLPSTYKPIAESRRQANEIKKREPITVVIGNPPYKEKAKGLGGWVAADGEKGAGILSAWMPPAEWGVGAHAKHIHNLYIYFWRWATWKVFDEDEKWKEGDQKTNTGIVCFITVAGFLNGPGFEKMRDYLRHQCDEIWVIDCSPEGHQPAVNTRVFQGVQQPVCIVLALRTRHTDTETPAKVFFRALLPGRRESKFEALSDIRLDGEGWAECPTGWRTGFLPASTGIWPTFPALADFFVYNGSGVMPGRTWVIAPDTESLLGRWQRLIEAPKKEQEDLFHPHLPKGKLGDRHSMRLVSKGLPGHAARTKPVALDDGGCVMPTRYALRSFDRQWIIPDNRLLNRPNPQLWEWYSDRQVFLTAPSERSPTAGPALTFTSMIPDLHHYNGRGGRTFPLWRDSQASESNLRPALLKHLSELYARDVSAQDLLGYLAAVAAHPAFTARFQTDLVKPGLRVPLTADPDTFIAAVELGREVIWLHTFGERFSAPSEGRPEQPPRLRPTNAPRIPADGAIGDDPKSMPDTLGYDALKRRLLVGRGFVEGVSPQVWNYEVSGKQVLRQWFSYRKANRERPVIGTRRQPSKLNETQPDHWLAEYTTELIHVLNVIGLLIELEPRQADLLERVCSGATLTVEHLTQAGALALPLNPGRKTSTVDGQDSLFDDKG
jgi:hypothetical protein